MLRELDSRTSDNGRISVFLFWDSRSQSSAEFPPLLVTVKDSTDSTVLTIPCETTAEALEAFHHPFAVANSVLKSGHFSGKVA